MHLASYAAASHRQRNAAVVPLRITATRRGPQRCLSLHPGRRGRVAVLRGCPRLREMDGRVPNTHRTWGGEAGPCRPFSALCLYETVFKDPDAPPRGPGREAVARRTLATGGALASDRSSRRRWWAAAHCSLRSNYAEKFCYGCYPAPHAAARLGPKAPGPTATGTKKNYKESTTRG